MQSPITAVLRQSYLGLRWLSTSCWEYHCSGLVRHLTLARRLGHSVKIMLFYKSHSPERHRTPPSLIKDEDHPEGSRRGNVSWEKFYKHLDVKPTIQTSFFPTPIMSPCFSNDAKQVPWTILCSSPNAWQRFIRHWQYRGFSMWECSLVTFSMCFLVARFSSHLIYC